MENINKEILEKYLLKKQKYDENKINASNECDIDCLEEKVIKLVNKSNKTSEDIKDIKLIKETYKILFKKMPLIIINSSVFKDKMCRKILIKDYIKKVQIVEMLQKDKIDNLYQKYINNENLQIDELKFLFTSLESKIGTKKEDVEYMQIKCIEKILLGNNIKSLYEVLFLIKFFIDKECKNKNLKKPGAYFVYNEIKGFNFNKSKGYKNTAGAYWEEQNVIGIRPHVCFAKKINKKVILNFLIAASHELEHSLQNNYKQKKEINRLGINYLVESIIKNNSYQNEYHENYNYKESEIDANINGIDNVIRFLEKYSKENNEKEIMILNEEILNLWYRYSYNLLKYENGKKDVLQVYKIKNLNKILKKDKNLLEENPQLKLFYKENGILKSLKNLIKEYVEIIEREDINVEIIQYLDIYSQYFDYYLITCDINKINLEKYEDKEKLYLFMLISEAYYRELRKLQVLNILEKKHQKNNYIKQIKIRKELIKKYYDYLVKNQVLINELINNTNIETYGNLTTKKLELAKNTRGIKF